MASPSSSIQITVVTPEAQALDEKAGYVNLPAWDGQLGVACDRAPMVIKLANGPMRLDMPSGGSKLYFVGGGFAQLTDNRLTILTPEAIAVEKLNAEEAKAALAEALARKAITDDEYARWQDDISRARTQLQLASN